ncbi:MAG: hypothetical protein J6B63_05755, partial [Treponema sp.]|nr:hypothetical protein [Treponema sp.]
NFEEFNSILEPSLNDDGSVTSSTMQIEANKNDSFYFYCEVTNTNENATENKVASVRSNTVQVACIEGTGNQFTLFQKNSDGTELSNVTGAIISSLSEGITKVIVTNPQSSDSVWTYFVKPNNNTRFTESANYKVSVELKADKTTVVGIAAARADYFFTVNSDWTPCEFETGYVKGSTDHDFTIGLGLSSEIEIRNLKIEKLETTDTIEPSLVFDISKDAINSYLENNNNRPGKIIEVSKETKFENNLGYTITINAPLSYKEATGATVQDVKLHLRSYGKETGANRVSFRVDNLGDNTFYTSVMADTANEKSTAWNNGTNPIDPGKFGSYEIDFPNYVANDELIVDVITSSNEAIAGPIQLHISAFAVTKDFSYDDPPFANKFFAIQIDETWEKIENGAPFPKEVTIKATDCINFDVGLFNGFSDEQGTPSDFVDVTRFLYTGNTNITDKITYKEEYDDSGNPKFKITNNSNEEKTVKISLNENYEVVIEESTSTSGGGNFSK